MTVYTPKDFKTDLRYLHQLVLMNRDVQFVFMCVLVFVSDGCMGCGCDCGCGCVDFAPPMQCAGTRRSTVLQLQATSWTFDPHCRYASVCSVWCVCVCQCASCDCAWLCVRICVILRIARYMHVLELHTHRGMVFR